MSTLNRLIGVVLSRAKQISLEDAVDDVAQYFDEISSPAPVAVTPEYTDDQLLEQTAEVTGLSRPTLQELLDDKDNYTPYLNQSGKSNVEGFKAGDDWVLVMFKDYSYYLYTRQSCTDYILQSIKDFAVRGQGLNGYINKMVRSDYAAKQKGITTLIRPGMETFDHKLLHLLIAYKRTTPEGNVSVEEYAPYRQAVLELKASVEAAGVDGLGKDAQRVLQINLTRLDKSVGYVQPGLEAYALPAIDLPSLEHRLTFTRKVE